ncbi:MAG TPA: DUF4158 domain-containing protein [Chloroflexota bacterium]|nr:DUF4158 domain-containing protein [Chloroflexota bacterium]
MTERETENKTDKRLIILGPDEIEAIYGLPVFDEEDRAFHFTLLPPERAALSSLHSVKSRLYFILQLGYFKARHQFFIFTAQDVWADVRYVQQTYFPDFELTDFAITKVTRLKQQRIILDLLLYRYPEDADRQQLQLIAQQVAKVDSQPIYILRELLHRLAEQRLIAPGYTFLQDTVGQALQYEQNRLIAVANAHLSDDDKAALNKLLSNPHGLYEITRLKREPKDFSSQEITQEIKRGEQIQALYGAAKRLLPHLDISNESIKYYAGLVTYYSVYQLNQLDQQLVSIYLLCFVYHRYQKLHDNLIRCFIYHVKRYLVGDYPYLLNL